MLDAVRSKHPGVTPEEVNFLTAFDASLEEALNERLTAQGADFEKRSASAVEEALKRTVGELPKNDKGETSTIVEQIRGMAESVDKLQSMSARRLSGAEKFQLRKMIDSEFDNIRGYAKKGTGASIFEFDAIRAAAPHTTANTVTGASVTTDNLPQLDNELVLLRYPPNFITDIIRSRLVSKLPQSKIRREQASVEGGAAIVAEGGVKPIVQFKFSDHLYTRDKWAGHMELTEEFEMDKEALYNAIIDLFEEKVLMDWHDGILGNIISAASTYVATGLDGTIEKPNMYTAIGAGILQVQNLNFQPDVLWMNHADVWAMNLTQDTTGQFVLPPSTFGGHNIAGLRLYISNKVEAGKFLIGQSSTWKEEHTAFELRIGWINDQFITNEKTIVGELYSMQYQPFLHQGSWLYGDIDAINAALLVETPIDGGGGGA
jgi:hypothetical protein